MDELKYELPLPMKLFLKLYFEPLLEREREFEKKYSVNLDSEGKVIPYAVGQ